MPTVISAVFQVSLFSILPVIWWSITDRKRQGFFSWIGLWVPTFTPKLIAWIVLGSVVIAGPGLLLSMAMPGPIRAGSAFAGHGLANLHILVIYAFVHTALSEEILFRGFVVKRLIDGFGFAIGNTLQAVVFALVHMVMIYLLLSGGWLVIGVGLVTGIAGALMAYINEKQADGSIIPSWIMHGCGNLLSGILVAIGVLS